MLQFFFFRQTSKEIKQLFHEKAEQQRSNSG